MKTKKLIVLLVAVVFTLGVVGLGLFWRRRLKAQVFNIEGSQLTIQDIWVKRQQ